MEIIPSLLLGEVWHKRFFPRVHEFVYRVYYIVIPVSEPSSASRRLFSINRFNIWSMRISDHGARNGSAWEPWVRNILTSNGIDTTRIHDIELMAHPRLFGYAFNPISFWFCMDDEEKIRAVVCEVRNTFGDRQNYIVAHEGGRSIEPSDRIEGTKVMHVSPFNTVVGVYHFQFERSQKTIRARVDYFVDGKKMIATEVAGSRVLLTDRALLRAFFLYPLLTFKVILGIHYEAARLWILKRMPYQSYTPHTRSNPEIATRDVEEQ
jgi:uncharacterized protein